MIGVSISLYDKFNDLKILIDIIRENWDQKYFISVCSNHPEAEKKVDGLMEKIDHFEKGADISYKNRYTDEANFRMRVSNTIRTAIEGAMAASEVGKVMHLHADAWPLSEESFISLTESMNQRGASVAFKVATEKFLNWYPPGHFMDQFIIFDADECIKNNLFDNYEYSLPVDIHSHRILPMVCLTKLGWNNVYHYSTRYEEEYWDGTRTRSSGRLARPMMYNPTYKQVHIAAEDFPSDIGRSLQAYYLETHGLTDGKYIDDFIDKYSINEQSLFDSLESYIDGIDEELKWYYGLTADTLHRDPAEMTQYTDPNGLEKFREMTEYHVRLLRDKLFGRFERIIGQTLFTNDKDDSKRLTKNRKNETLHEYYSRVLDADEYPKTFKETFIHQCSQE